jgi:hypothetical protein
VGLKVDTLVPYSDVVRDTPSFFRIDPKAQMAEWRASGPMAEWLRRGLQIHRHAAEIGQSSQFFDDRFCATLRGIS